MLLSSVWHVTSGTSASWGWYTTTTTSDDIMGSRISSAGQVLDRALAIQQSPDMEYGQFMACNPGTCLVAWKSDLRTVLARRVTSTGGVVDSTPISITLGSEWYHDNFVLAADGTNFLLSWTTGQYSASDQRVGLRLGPEGKVLDSNRLVLSQPEFGTTTPVVAFGGGVYLMAWYTTFATDGGYGHDVGRLSALRISATGKVMDAAPILVADTTTDHRYPSVTWMGSSFLVTWDRLQQGVSWDIVGRRVRADGSFIDAEPFLIAGDPKVSEGPGTVASNGKGVAIVGYDRWDGASIYGSRRVRFRLITSLPACAVCASSAECENGVCSNGVCAGACGVDAGIVDAVPDVSVVRDGTADTAREAAAESARSDLAPDYAIAPDVARAVDAGAPHVAADARPSIDVRSVLAADAAPPAADAGRPDAGYPDAGRDAVASAGKSGCQCSTGAAHAGRPAVLPVLGMLIAGLLARRRTREGRR
jgi:MYXO-CTERM domain-containing protein